MKKILVNKAGTRMRFETVRMLIIPKNYFFEYSILTELEIFAENLQELYYYSLIYLSNLIRFIICVPNLIRIDRQALMPLYNLEDIRLEADNIIVFDQDFTFMSKLQKITLILPKVSYLNYELFKNNLQLEIANLTLLNVNHNNITSTRSLKFSAHNYQGLRDSNIEMFLYLQKLIIDGMKITIESYVEICRSNLTYLTLRRCFLRHISFIKYLINLTYLDLSYNNIILEYFNFHKNCKLQHLNLSYNNIGVIKKDHFYGLNDLKSLNMIQCQIFEYENTLLTTSLQKITYLNFSKNYLLTIKQSLFSKIKHLIILDLRCCMIEDISRKAFRSLKQLNTLEISHNRIKNFSENTFYKLKTLTFLNINHNAIKEFNINKLFQSKYVKNLKILNLSYNDITKIPINNFANLTKLTDLNLKFNYITLISDHSFTNLSNLIILNLSYNSIEIIGSKAFNDLCYLEVLNLSHNLIKYLDKDVFSMLKNLNFLDLSNNCIQLINRKIFNKNCKLENIQLDFNEITELPRDVFYLNEQLKFLNVSFNPLLHLITFEMFRYCKQFHLLIINENLITKVDKILKNKIDISNM